MSTQRGNVSRTRAQKYKNATVYKKDLHGTTPQTKSLENLKIEGLCPHCKSVLEWKVKFNKYKKLTAPATCARCLQKTVKEAYHTWCRQCSEATGACPKCCQTFSADKPVTDAVPQMADPSAVSPRAKASSASSDDYASPDEDSEEEADSDD